MFNDVISQVLDAAYSPWAFIILTGFILVDAVFPAVPSESIVISMASIFITGDWRLLPVLWLVSVGAAWCGDNIAYQIGTWKKLSNNRIIRRPKIQSSLAWAKNQLKTRGATIIVVGRFIPGARIAINVMCGMLAYPRPRYMGIVVASSTIWATYSVVIGSVAGAWFAEHHLIGVLVAIGLGIVLGPAIDWLIRKLVLSKGVQK